MKPGSCVDREGEPGIKLPTEAELRAAQEWVQDAAAGDESQGAAWAVKLVKIAALLFENEEAKPEPVTCGCEGRFWRWEQDQRQWKHNTQHWTYAVGEIRYCEYCGYQLNPDGTARHMVPVPTADTSMRVFAQSIGVSLDHICDEVSEYAAWRDLQGTDQLEPVRMVPEREKPDGEESESE